MGGGAKVNDEQLIALAHEAARHSWSPYSGYAVGAALLFEDGAVITGTNVENASYGLSLCAETVAVGKALAEGRRGGLSRIAVVGPADKGDGAPITPCGRCRQVLNELAQIGGSDPSILCVGREEVREIALSALLPHAFGPAHLD
jgi:cytidine deaminase